MNAVLRDAGVVAALDTSRRAVVHRSRRRPSLDLMPTRTDLSHSGAIVAGQVEPPNERIGMFVLVAATPTREIEPVDGRTAIDGELVIAPIRRCECDRPCTCDRAWHGVVSDGTTPTAIVARRPGVTREQLRTALIEMVERNRWATAGSGTDDHTEWMVDQQLRTMSQILCEHPVGTVLARHGEQVYPVDLHSAA